MSGLNKVQIIGNLGRDVETHTFENGDKKASFSVAVSESYKDKQGNKVEVTDWFNVVLWKGIAGVAEKYLSKGSKVYIEGKLRTREYEKDGEKRYVTEVIGDNMVMLSSNNNSASNRDDGFPQ